MPVVTTVSLWVGYHDAGHIGRNHKLRKVQVYTMPATTREWFKRDLARSKMKKKTER